MKITRLYTGPDGQSHFEDITLSLTSTEYGNLTSTLPVTGMVVGEVSENLDIPWHNAPRPQYVIMLQGGMEIEIGDGSKRLFHEGDIVLAEDTTGRGHLTRGVGKAPRKYLVLHCGA